MAQYDGVSQVFVEDWRLERRAVILSSTHSLAAGSIPAKIVAPQRANTSIQAQADALGAHWPPGHGGELRHRETFVTFWRSTQ